MKINKIYSLVFLLASLLFAQSSFACGGLGVGSLSSFSFSSMLPSLRADIAGPGSVEFSESMSVASVLTLWTNLAYSILLLPGIFSPAMLYWWYVKRGGRKKRLIFPLIALFLIYALAILLPINNSIKDYLSVLTTICWTIGPFVCLYLYSNNGGTKKWFWTLWIFLLIAALVFKGLVSLVLC
jgi:hypothetical protein